MSVKAFNTADELQDMIVELIWTRLASSRRRYQQH
jgi:hypothetical protein